MRVGCPRSVHCCFRGDSTPYSSSSTHVQVFTSHVTGPSSNFDRSQLQLRQLDRPWLLEKVGFATHYSVSLYEVQMVAGAADEEVDDAE